jgi:hypothetical protein
VQGKLGSPPGRKKPTPQDDEGQKLEAAAETGVAATRKLATNSNRLSAMRPQRRAWLPLTTAAPFRRA